MSSPIQTVRYTLTYYNAIQNLQYQDKDGNWSSVLGPPPPSNPSWKTVTFDSGVTSVIFGLDQSPTGLANGSELAYLQFITKNAKSAIGVPGWNAPTSTYACPTGQFLTAISGGVSINQDAVNNVQFACSAPPVAVSTTPAAPASAATPAPAPASAATPAPAPADTATPAASSSWSWGTIAAIIIIIGIVWFIWQRR